MVLNYIWIAFFLIAFVIATFRLVFLGDAEVFPEIINSTFSSSKTAFEISLGLTGVLSLWLGIMKIAIEGDNKATRLFINGKQVEELNIQERWMDKEGKTRIRNVRTLVFPLEKAGNFKSKIAN